MNETIQRYGIVSEMFSQNLLRNMNPSSFGAFRMYLIRLYPLD